MQEWIEPEWLFVDLAAIDSDVFWLDSGNDDGVSYVGTGSRASVADVENAPARAERGTDLFGGGWVGWLDYEYGAAQLGLVTEAADPRWMRVTDVVRFDHRRRSVQVRGSELFRARVAAVTTPPQTPAAVPVAPARVRVTPAAHADAVAQCREAILAGDAYQLCLTTRFTVDGHHDAVQTYRRLRAASPSHHGGFIRIGDTALLSISPEQFLTVDGDRVSTKPIKGTRPRGITAAEDAALAAELAADEKERAENVMIVDLMRNDLSRICLPGSVQVDGLWQVETYPTVHQLVSTVSGELRDQTTVGDLWTATFPAGSMTGAPKLSAMTILQGLEGATRGVYSGCFGWVGHNGGMDLAMVIRSVVVTPTAAYVGSGGGITWGSQPAMEVAEVGIKARAPLAALGSECPAGW